ncbi:MAG: AmmeMemoRadiSam system protein B [archaeon]
MRKCVVAGQFYPKDKDELMEIIDIFLSEVQSVERHKIIGGVVPHAGYIFSGKTAGYFFKSLIDSNFDTFIILGTNHSGLGDKIALSLEDFETPLGIVKNDKKLSEELLKYFKLNEQAHKSEHSIEVQLPFLQVVKKKFTFVPILVKDLNLEDIKDYSEKIASSIGRHSGKVCIIASSDFTHYGRVYGFTSKEDIKTIDKRVIDKILEYSVGGFLKEAGKTSVCGKDAIALCMEVCMRLGSKKAKELKYSTSAEVSGDKNIEVGYASLVFV